MSALADELRAAVAPELAEVTAEVRRLALEVAQLRAALPSPKVSLADAARLQGVSLATARREVAAHRWPSVRVGRRVLVDVSKLPQPLTDDEVARAAREARGS